MRCGVGDGWAVDNPAVAKPWEWDETLYAQSAAYYVAGRMAYPSRLAEQIAAAVGLSGASRALDVGCGPGALTLMLARHVGQIIGIDADPEMVAQAEMAAQRAGVGNVGWRRMRGEQLPGDLGRFDLVTFAQSFHWMERVKVARTVLAMLSAGGACVHVHATTHRGDSSVDALPRPRPPYQEIEALARSYLGPTRRAGRSAVPGGARDDEDDIYREAGFDGPTRFEVPRGEVIERTVDEVVAATFSLSSSTPHLFGDRRAEFEADLRAVLGAASDDGRFCERARDVAFDVWRPLGPTSS